MSPYLLLKLAHVFLAIVAIGTNLSYSLWLRAGEREPAHPVYTIRGIRAIDRRVANPAYALLLVTGLLIILVTGIPLTQLWLLLAIAIYVAAAIIGYFVFGRSWGASSPRSSAGAWTIPSTGVAGIRRERSAS